MKKIIIPLLAVVFLIGCTVSEQKIFQVASQGIELPSLNIDNLEPITHSFAYRILIKSAAECTVIDNQLNITQCQITQIQQQIRRGREFPYNSIIIEANGRIKANLVIFAMGICFGQEFRVIDFAYMNAQGTPRNMTYDSPDYFSENPLPIDSPSGIEINLQSVKNGLWTFYSKPYYYSPYILEIEEVDEEDLDSPPSDNQTTSEPVNKPSMENPPESMNVSKMTQKLIDAMKPSKPIYSYPKTVAIKCGDNILYQDLLNFLEICFNAKVDISQIEFKVLPFDYKLNDK